MYNDLLRITQSALHVLKIAHMDIFFQNSNMMYVLIAHIQHSTNTYIHTAV